MAPESRDEVASRDEVRQRIESLYDQAETATGNYNATRAMASATRTRGVPSAKRSGRRADPVLDEVARPWFDGARAKLGPTVPAVLPADRLPDRPSAPGRSGQGRGDGLPDGVRGALGSGPSARRPPALERAVDRVVAELAAGRATDPESLALAARQPGRAALPGRTRLELPIGNQELTAADDPGTPDLTLPDTTAALPVPARPTPEGAPAPEPRTLPGATTPARPSPGTSKANNQRKLAAASDVISRYAAQLLSSAAAVQSAPVTPLPAALITAEPPPPAQTDPGFTTGEWQQPQWTTPTDPATPPPTTDTWPPQATSTPLSAIPTSYTATPSTQTAPVLTPYAPAAPVPAPYAPTNSAPAASAPTTSAPPNSVPEAYAPAAPAPTASVPEAYAPAALAPTPSDTTAPTPMPSLPEAPVTTASTAMPYDPIALVTTVPAPAPDPSSPDLPSSPDTGVLPPSVGAPEAVRVGKAVAFARAQIGKPCVWGATGPDSYDCSSLTQAAWRAAGVTLPRAAHQQALAGAPVTLAGIEAGDLVLFFDDDRHVGLHVGGGMMVHAPGPGSSIREESIYGAGESAIHRIVRPA
ncbi:C40 family peptidase [Streptomyces alanosinicus]|uniref:NlpC/P60 domain-containing protein n=1 Tax=Streptomyces alanosinicus TaxID=68171 RepID=A0A919D474_9ACTN|nr:hypothetical protein GCM10010339_45300 [Streptomyces alanosinicus]